MILHYTYTQRAKVIARAMPPDARAWLMSRDFGIDSRGRSRSHKDREDRAIQWLVDSNLFDEDGITALGGLVLSQVQNLEEIQPNSNQQYTSGEKWQA